jgi:hypothetical protein
MNKSKRIVLAWSLGIFLIAYLYAFILRTTAAAQDVDECRVITSSVISRHNIPASVSSPGRPAIFCDLGVHFPFLQTYDSIFIYGILNPPDQDAILADLRDLHHVSHTRKMLVQFFKQENWKTWSDPATGAGGGSRGPESPIVRTWID